MGQFSSIHQLLLLKEELYVVVFNYNWSLLPLVVNESTRLKYCNILLNILQMIEINNFTINLSLLFLMKPFNDAITNFVQR